MKVVISHCYSNDNSGDAALLAALIADVKQAFGNVDLVALTMDDIQPSTSFEGVPLRASFMYYVFNTIHFRPAKLVVSALIVTWTLAWAIAARMRVRLPLSPHLKSLCQLYRDADLVVAVGGGYLSGKTGLASTVTLTLMAHPIWLAAILRTPTVIYPQSIGPFGNRAQRSLVRHALDSVDLLLVREDISMRVVSEMHVHSEVVRSVDGAFALPDVVTQPAPKCIERHGKCRPLVGITVRAWLAGEQQTTFEKSVAEVCDYLVREGYYVIFIPQVTSVHHNDDDREVAARVRAFMRLRGNVEVISENLDYLAVRKLCASCDYLIGTRFHSVIFALSGQVPACAIEYEHKTSGIMRDLGLETWVMRIEDVTASELVAMMKRLIAAREEYELHLDTVLPAYSQLAAKTHESLRAVARRRGLVGD